MLSGLEIPIHEIESSESSMFQNSNLDDSQLIEYDLTMF
jgi:hypothetical protein